MADSAESLQVSKPELQEVNTLETVLGYLLINMLPFLSCPPVWEYMRTTFFCPSSVSTIIDMMDTI